MTAFRPITIKLIATCALLALTSGCSSLQGTPAKAVYDFGPGPLTLPATNRTAPAPALVLTEIESSAALDGTSVLYRLAYADAQQLQPYALARWSMSPAHLVRQRLRDSLSLRGPVLNAGDGNVPLVLRVELDEFSQLFEAVDKSSGLLRLRATLTRNEALVGQRSFIVQRLAPSADAAGGVRALSAATDAVVDEIGAWLAQTLR